MPTNLSPQATWTQTHEPQHTGTHPFPHTHIAHTDSYTLPQFYLWGLYLWTSLIKCDLWPAEESLTTCTGACLRPYTAANRAEQELGWWQERWGRRAVIRTGLIIPIVTQDFVRISCSSTYTTYTNIYKYRSDPMYVLKLLELSNKTKW